MNVTAKRATSLKRGDYLVLCGSPDTLPRAAAEEFLERHPKSRHRVRSVQREGEYVLVELWPDDGTRRHLPPARYDAEVRFWVTGPPSTAARSRVAEAVSS